MSETICNEEFERNFNNSTVYVKTIQGSVIKNLFESIKEILVDVNIEFTDEYIKSTSIDKNKSALVYFKLDADKFEIFKVTQPITVGLNMYSVFRLIKSVSNHDIVSFFILENKRHELNIHIENIDKKTCIKFKLGLLDIDHEIITIPDVKYDNVIVIHCADFQRYCKDMLSISNKVTMECRDESFILSCTGDYASQEININGCNTTVLNYEDKTSNMKETFSLKYINLFIKSTNLCSTVEIYLKSQYPLILVYRIGQLGKIQYCLAPEHDDSNS